MSAPNASTRHPRVRTRASSRRLVLGLLAGALVLSACRMDVDTRVEVDQTGGGVLAVDVRLDDDLWDRITATGFDPTPSGVTGWQVATSEVDGGRLVTMATSFTDPVQLQDRVAALQEGLDDEDPGLVEAIDLVVGPDGSTTIDAVVGLRLPSSTGVEGAGFADGEDLAVLAADPERLAATFTVVLPGPVVDHNADTADGSTLRWRLPPGDEVRARATAGPPDALGSWVVPAIATGLLVLVVVVGVVVLRRRRRDRRRAPHGRVERLTRWSP